MIQPRSLRLRVTLLSTAIAILVLLAFATVVVLFFRLQLLANLDHSLEQRADQIAAESAYTSDTGTSSDDSSSFANSNTADRFAQLLSAEGEPIAWTPNLDGFAPLVEVPSRQTQFTKTIETVDLDDDSYRILVRRFARPGGDQILVVGENTDDLHDSVRALVILLTVMIPIAVGALGLVTWWLVGRTLGSVESIRSEVASITSSEMHRRVPESDSGDEIALLAQTMNDMLGRLQESAIQQQRFVADASHELRSPLTRMRTELEVDLRRPDADLQATAESVLEETASLQQLTEDLLYLAQSDAETSSPPAVPVDLDHIVDSEVRHLRRGTSIVVDQTLVSAAETIGVASQLGRVVRNLLDNAARHAKHRIAINLQETPDRVILMIDDDGPGIPTQDRGRVFERFTRLDEARSSGVGGTGLGLAICQEIVNNHGGTISVDSSPLGGARFTVILPRPAIQPG